MGSGSSSAAAPFLGTTRMRVKREAAGGGAGGVGDGGAGEEALRAEAGAELGDQGFLAAEEVGAAGDVEHQGGGTFIGDEGGVALGPVGDPVEQGGDGGGVLVGGDERGNHGAGVGERLAAGEAETLGGLVEGDEAEGVLHLRDDGEGWGWLSGGQPV